jgi:hypothetical protein
MLLQLGCELAQGYGIARPMPASDLPAWATAWQPDVAWRDLNPVSRADLPLLFASVEHRAWIVAMKAHLRDDQNAPPPHDLHQCRFGAWLDAEGEARYSARPEFPVIKQIHAHAHALAEELCALRDRSGNAAAVARLGELRAARDALLAQLQLLLRKDNR